MLMLVPFRMACTTLRPADRSPPCCPPATHTALAARPVPGGSRCSRWRTPAARANCLAHPAGSAWRPRAPFGCRFTAAAPSPAIGLDIAQVFLPAPDCLPASELQAVFHRFHQAGGAAAPRRAWPVARYCDSCWSLQPPMPVCLSGVMLAANQPCTTSPLRCLLWLRPNPRLRGVWHSPQVSAVAR